MGAYLYGDLSPEEMKSVRLHTRECEACREDLRLRAQAVSYVPDNPPELTDADKNRITDSVNRADKSNTVQKKFKLKLVPALGIAVVLLIGFAVGSLIRQHNDRSDEINQANTGSRTIVQITEEPKTYQQRNNDDARQASIRPRRHRSSPLNVEGVAETARRSIASDMIHRGGDNNAEHQQTETEKPSPVVQDKKENTESKDGESGRTQLPKPTDLNDTQTTDSTSKQ